MSDEPLNPGSSNQTDSSNDCTIIAELLISTHYYHLLLLDGILRGAGGGSEGGALEPGQRPALGDRPPGPEV